jgi:ParB family chromosome partitioning protein
MQLPIDDIAPNPRQPRQSMDSRALEELAASIQEHGIIQPLIVTRSDPADGGPPYRIVAGERRWRAARLAGLSTVPVIVKDATPQAMLEWALVENLQRADLNPLEMATAYRALMDEFGLTQEDVAARVGKSRVAVANTVRLLRLPDEIKDALTAGQISEGHARALLGLDEEDAQLRALDLVIRRGLSVRQTEELVRRINAAAEVARRAAAARSPETRALEDRFRAALGTKVDLLRSRRGGRLVIHFYSEEELQNIYDLIVGREG